MVYNDVEDGAEDYQEHNYKFPEYEPPQEISQHVNGSINEDPAKGAIVFTITSNDNTMHLPSIRRAFINAFSQFSISENDRVELVCKIMDAIIKHDEMTTCKWEFSIPLIGPDFNKLIIQVYPTLASWQHLRFRKNKDCPNCNKHNCLFPLERDDSGTWCTHCSYDTREPKCTLADFMEMIE